MKWMTRLLLACAVLVSGLVAYAMATALDSERPVGFRTVQVEVPAGPPFLAGVWYPTSQRPWPTTLVGTTVMEVAADAPVAGRELPLVVLSHGNGGGIGSHADLALALASAGYVVAAPMHPGDNFRDQSGIRSAAVFNARAGHLRATLDHLLTRWDGRDHLDPARIGAYGFSAGGFTVLSMIGAEPDFRRVARHCADAAEFACDLLREAGSPLVAATSPDAGGRFEADPRIRAAALAAPGLAFAFDPASLARVTVPVQLWSAERDTTVPYATNAGPVRTALGPAVDFESVPGAGHLSFLAPCGLIGPPALCADEAGFDRSAFHARMNARVVGFFDRHLRAR